MHTTQHLNLRTVHTQQSEKRGDLIAQPKRQSSAIIGNGRQRRKQLARHTTVRSKSLICGNNDCSMGEVDRAARSYWRRMELKQQPARPNQFSNEIPISSAAAELGGNLPATGNNTQGKWLQFAMEHTQQSARPNQFSSKIIVSSVRRNWQAKQNTWHSHSRNDVNNKRNDIFHQVPYPKTVIQTTPVDESLGISISIVMVMRG